MSTAPVDIALYLGFAIIGFLAKFLFERYSKHKDAVRFESWRLEVANLEQKLSQFYWPVHCRLQSGTIAWESRNFRGRDKDKEKFVAVFDQEIIIKNHQETRDIIQANFHHFGGDKRLEAELIKLLHHIDVYLALRSSDSQNDPIWVGQPWPDEINNLIQASLHDLQSRYDSLLAKAQSPY